MKFFTREWHQELDIAKKLMPIDQYIARINDMNDKYRTHYCKLLKLLPRDFEYVALRFHDFIVKSSTFISTDYCLQLDPRGYPTDVCGIVFENAVIMKDSEGFCEGFCWLADELYLTEDNRYEIHILMENRRACKEYADDHIAVSGSKGLERIETIIICDDVRLIRNTGDRS